METSNVNNLQMVASYYWSDVYKLMKTYHETNNYEKLNVAVKVISPFLSKIMDHFEPYVGVTKIKSDEYSRWEHFVSELSMYFNLKFECTYLILTSYLNNSFCDNLNNFEKKIVIPEERVALKNSIRVFLESERMGFLKIFKTIIEYAVFERREFHSCSINGVKEPTIDCIISLITSHAEKGDPVPDNILKELSQLFECLCLFGRKDCLKLIASDINRILVAYNQLLESPGITRNGQYNLLRNSFYSFAICCTRQLNSADILDVSVKFMDLNSHSSECILLNIILEFAKLTTSPFHVFSPSKYELSTALKALSDTLKQYQSQVDFSAYLYSTTHGLMVDIFDIIYGQQPSFAVYTDCLKISKVLFTIDFEISSISLNHFWHELTKCLSHYPDFISDFIDITLSIMHKNEKLATAIIFFICNIRICNMPFLENFEIALEKVIETYLLDSDVLFVSQWKFLNYLIGNKYYINANGNKIILRLILPNIVTIVQRCPEIVEQVYDTLFRAILDQQLLNGINEDMLIELVPYVSRVNSFDTLSPKSSLLDTYIAKDFDITNSNCPFSSQLLLNYLTFLVNVIRKRQSVKYVYHIIKNGIKFILFTVIPRILTLFNVDIDYYSSLMKKIIVIFSHVLLVKYEPNPDLLQSYKPYVIENIFNSNFFAICLRIFSYQNSDFLSFVDNNNNNVRYNDPKITLLEIFFDFFNTIMQNNWICLHFIQLDKKLLALSKEIDNRDIVFELFSLTCNCVSVNLRWLAISFFRKLNVLKSGSVLEYFGSCKPNKVSPIYRLLLSKVETVQLKCEILLFLNECYDKNNQLFQRMFIVDQGVLPKKPSMLNPLPVTNPKNALIAFLKHILIKDVKISESIVQYFSNPTDRHLLYELCARLLRSLWLNEQAYLLEHLYGVDFWTILTKLLFEPKEICLQYISSALHIFDILSFELEKGLLCHPDKENARDILSKFFDNDYFHYFKWLNIFSEKQFIESIEKNDDSKLLKIDRGLQKLCMNMYCTYSTIFDEHVLKFLINSLSKGVNIRFGFYAHPNNNIVYFRIFESFLRIAFRNHYKVIDLIDIENLKTLLINIKIYFSTLSITYRQCVYDLFYNLMVDDMQALQNRTLDILVGLMELFAEELTVFHQFSAKNTSLSVKKSTVYSILSIINMNLMKDDTCNQLIPKEILNVFIENIWRLVEKIYLKAEYVDFIYLVCITLSLIVNETLSIIKISQLKYLRRFVVPSQSCLDFLTTETTNDLANEQFQQWSYLMIAINNLLISFIDVTQKYGAKLALTFVQYQSISFKKYLDLYNFNMDTLIINTNTTIVMLLNKIVKHVEPMRWLEIYGLFFGSILHSVEFYSILMANPNHVLNITQKNNNETRAEFFDRLKLHENRLLIYMNLGVSYMLAIFRNHMDTEVSCIGFFRVDSLIHNISYLDSSFNKIVSASILNLISVIEIIDKNFNSQHSEFLNLLKNTGRIDNNCLRLDLLDQKLENDKIFVKQQFVDNIHKYSSIDKELLCDLDFNLVFSLFTQMSLLLYANMSFCDNMLCSNALDNFTKLNSFMEKLKTKYESSSFNDSKEHFLIENLSFVGYAIFSILNHSRYD